MESVFDMESLDDDGKPFCVFFCHEDWRWFWSKSYNGSDEGIYNITYIPSWKEVLNSYF